MKKQINVNVEIPKNAIILYPDGKPNLGEEVVIQRKQDTNGKQVYHIRKKKIRDLKNLKKMWHLKRLLDGERKK